MALADIYKTGGHQRNLGHFANIVKLALSDDIITDEEQRVIDRLKRELHITNSDYEKVMKSPSSFPINPPSNLEARLERLYNLITIVIADNKIENQEVKILEKISFGLGFTALQVENIIEKSINLVVEGLDSDKFSDEIKKVL